MKLPADIGVLLSKNAYPGRGIAVGLTEDGANAVAVYFIMGRSANSRNRVFCPQGEELLIRPFDAAKVEDPSLILYAPVRRCGRSLIVTNGDQTDTIHDFLTRGESFEAALETRRFEPDAPNHTPRISALLSFPDGGFSYRMSILKRGAADACTRQTFCYEPVSGLGHLIHTYGGDGNPLPSFQGEPVPVLIPNAIDAFTEEIWNSLNTENKISLFVRFLPLRGGPGESRVVNRNR